MQDNRTQHPTQNNQTKNSRELRKVIVHYRVMCNSDLFDRNAGIITQEEYADSISHRLDGVMKIFAQTKQETYKQAVKDCIDALPRLLTEEMFEQIKKEYPELDKTDYFHFAIDTAHTALNKLKGTE